MRNRRRQAFWGVFWATWLALAATDPAMAQPFRFAAIGDMPYRPPADDARVAALIADLNRRDLAFTVHIGDFKSGGSRCDDEIMLRVRALFETFDRPLVYTPGDNEWTDCHRASAGGYNPIERLMKLREVFFAGDLNFGKTRLAVAQQSQDPRFAKFVENLRWVHNNVLFATLHIVGSNNNLQRDRAAVLEYIERNDANLAWLRTAFAEATAQGHAAVVLAMQANPWFEKWHDERTGFSDFLTALERETIAFGRPVLLIHGDSHYFRIDQPLGGARGRPRIGNFFRLEVYGDRDVHGVIVAVDPADAVNPFAFQTNLVPANFNR
ncbi:MAG: hypothetical protein HY057_13690 [Rhodospirillales bacterium]|nr:hypothetical protein [Rhodospirillales bacterium]